MVRKKKTNSDIIKYLKYVKIASLAKNFGFKMRIPFLNKNHSLYGKCYVVAEALYYLLDGKNSGLKIKQARYKGISHWWLETITGGIIDLTKGQFNEPFPYHRGRTTAFLSRTMSKRTKLFLGEQNDQGRNNCKN